MKLVDQETGEDLDPGHAACHGGDRGGGHGGGDFGGGGGDARGALKRWKSAGSAAMIEAATRTPPPCTPSRAPSCAL